MEQKNPVDMALRSFRVSREDAEKMAATIPAEIENKRLYLAECSAAPRWRAFKHYWKGWETKSAIKQAEVELKYRRKHIEQYEKAEGELTKGNYQPAIDMLREQIPPIPEDVTAGLLIPVYLQSPLVADMTKLMKELALLQQQKMQEAK